MVTVSVIVPFLNAERYLPAAIGSVQAQTWTDWELLLVDDGSTDDSACIATTAADADPRIRRLRRPPDTRRGAAAARNLGIREARGSFVAFLDADDIYERDNLQSRLDAFARHPDAMMVYGPTRWWHPGLEFRDWTEGMRWEAGRVHQPPELLTRVILLQLGHVPCTCGVMIRRSTLDVTGGFDEAFDLYEDQTLWVKLMLRFPVYVTDVVGARYRQHADSVTAHSERAGVYARTRPHQARVAFLAWVRDYSTSNGLADRSVERALRVASAPYAGGLATLTPPERLTLVRQHLIETFRSSLGRVRRLLQTTYRRRR